MKSVKIKSFMPSRNGKMMIINPGAENIFITKEQWDMIKSANASSVSYVSETSYMKDGKEIPYAEGARNNFRGIGLTSLEEKLELMQKYGLNVAI